MARSLGGQGSHLASRFRVIDANADGTVTPDEAAAQVEEVFSYVDTDDSDELTEDEIMQTLGVAILMGGSPSAMYATHVVDAMEEFDGQVL